MLKKSGKFVPKCRLGGATLQSSLSNRKKLLILIISCITICALVLGVVLYCVATINKKSQFMAVSGPTNTDYWTDSADYYDTNWAGSGTEDDPFLIEEAADLAGLSYAIYSGTANAEYINGNYYYQNTYFRQTASIDLTEHYWRSIGGNVSGATYRYFSGRYDGGGNTISGLFINGQSYSALFAYVKATSDNRAEIKNIGIIDSYIQGSSDSAAIVGYASYADIIGCYNTSDVIGSSTNTGAIVGSAYNSSITDCYNTGAVTGSSSYTGGIAGRVDNNTIIRDCYNAGNISGTDQLGGIVGYTASNIINCHNTGVINATSSFVGGIVGQVSSSSVSIVNCYNEGTVTTTDNNVGGISGYYGIILDCYNSGAVSGDTYVGGINGYSGEAHNCLNTATITGNNCVGGILGATRDSNASVSSNTLNVGNVVSSGIKGGIAGILNSSAGGAGSITNSYYGGNCENIGAINGADADTVVYLATLTEDAKTQTWFENTSNWDISYPWDFEYTWEFRDGENLGYPVLTGIFAAKVTAYSYDDSFSVGEGWSELIYEEVVSGRDTPIIMETWVSSKRVPAGTQIGELPTGAINGLTLTMWTDNTGTTYNEITSSTIVNENMIIYARWEVTSSWQDYRSSGLQMQGTDFLISSAADLAFVSYQVEQGNSLYINGSYIQTANIDLSAHYWDPIGSQEHPFAGNYNGNGFTIAGMEVYQTPYVYSGIENLTSMLSESRHSGGLFEYVVGGSTEERLQFANIGIIDANISAWNILGALAGYAENVEFTNCYNEARVVGYCVSAGLIGEAKNCIFTECYNTGNIGGMGYVGDSSENLRLDPYAGSTYSGGLVCAAEGCQFTDCHNEGEVYSSRGSGGVLFADGLLTEDIYDVIDTDATTIISSCYNEGGVDGVMCGGIIGGVYNVNTFIQNCYNIGNIGLVTPVGQYVVITAAGGIASSVAGGTITNCYNSGNITGLLAAGGISSATSNGATISNCFNTGSVDSASSVFGHNVGGITADSSNSTLTNNYYGGNCSNIGGIDSSDSSGQAEYLPTLAEDATTEDWFQNESLWNPDYPWNIGEDWFIVDGYPTLEAPITWLDDPSYYDHKFTGLGTQASPYLITSNKELAGVAFLMLNNNSTYKNSYFRLTTNVDMSEYFWVPIGTTNALAFAGHFDGGNYTITGLRTYAGWDGVGLFGTVIGTSASHAVIENVVMEDITISANSYGGGVVGVGEYVEISNCRVIGETNTLKGLRAGGVIGYAMNSEIKDSYNNGTIEASGDYLGGVVGYANLSQVENCYATVSAVFTGSVSNVFTKTDSGNVGGLVGGAESSTIANCFNAGQANGTWGVSADGLSDAPLAVLSTGGIIGFAKTQAIVTDCYNLGLVSCDIIANGGGIAGKSDGATIQNCYNKGSLTSTTNLEGGIMAFGGIVGSPVNSTILKCTNYAGIDYYMAYAGGIAGMGIDILLMMMGGDINSYLANLTTTTIQNCYNYGNVETVFAGGIVCVAAKSEVIDCVNAGIVGFYDAVNRMYTDQAAGVAAMVVGDLTLNRVYNLGDIIGNNYVAGMIAMTQSLTGEIMTVNLNHCFNAGDIYGHGSNGAAGIIYEVVSTNLNITNSANVGDIHVILSNNGFYNRVRVSGLIGTNGGSGAGSNVGSITISNCIVKMGVYFDCNGAASIEENGGYVAGIGYELQTNSLVVANCAINITGIYYDDEDTSVNAVPDANVKPFFIYSVQEPSQVVSNTYALITNNTTGTQNNVVLDNGGMDGNFVYVEGMFDGMAVPVNIYHIEDYITSTGILEYLQQTFNVQPFVAA